jgi:phosphoribosylanthranilate isomerase
MIRIKFCGITSVDQALSASAAGADYLGLVMAPSRRQIMPVKAMEIIKALLRINSPVQTTGVFVNLPIADVNFIAEACRLDRVQLSGDEDWDYCRNIRKPVIKAIHISPGNTAQEVLENIKEGYRILGKEKLVCLLDSHVKGTYGGSGQTFDWHLTREVAAKFPVFVAGGLTPENVGNLIEDVQPWGVDVSSGVETKGQKDIQKIKEFIKEVKDRTC